VLRVVFERNSEDLEVVAINDPFLGECLPEIGSVPTSAPSTDGLAGCRPALTTECGVLAAAMATLLRVTAALMGREAE
jgi:hypothetical protein